MRTDLPLKYVLSVPGGGSNTDELPLVVCMHGRGADANDLADLAPLIDDGWRWLFPNAPKPFEAYPGMTFGYTWFDGWPPRGNSIAESRRLILDFLDAALQRYPTPKGKIILSGFSQGGLMALDTGYRTQQQLAGIVSMSGAIYEDELGDLEAHRDIPVLVIHGTADEMIPVLAARRTRLVLQNHGIDPDYHEFPMGHQVSQESMEAVGRFLRKSLK